MPTWIQSLGQAAGAQTAGNIISEGMGLMTQGIKNKQQLKQARKLQNMQLEGHYAQSQHDQAMALQLWDKTNYAAQIQQLKKAGLNPAMIYGMSGGGGATTGSSSGSPQGQNADIATPSKGSEGMGLMVGQLGLLQAQKENIEADTKLKQVEAAKKEGPDTENVKQDTLSKKATEELTRIQTEIAQVAASVSRQTINEQMKAWENLVDKQVQEIASLQNQNILSEEQRNDLIKQLKLQVLGESLKNQLTAANITQVKTATGEMVKVNDAMIKNWANQIAVAWTNAETGRSHLSEEVWKNIENSSEIPQEIKDLLPQALIPITGGKSGGSPIKGFHKRN